MSLQGLKDEVSRHNRYQILPVDLEDYSDEDSDPLACVRLQAHEFDVPQQRDSNDPQGFVSQDHAHTKAHIRYDGKSLTSFCYPTRIFINSKYKRRKFVDQIVSSKEVRRPSPVCRPSTSSDEQTLESLTPSGFIEKNALGEGGKVLFSIPSHTNVVQFSVSNSIIDRNDEEKLSLFLKSHADDDIPIDDRPVRHRRVEVQRDENGEFSVDCSNKDILSAFSEKTSSFTASLDSESKRVHVSHKIRKVRFAGSDSCHYSKFVSKPTVLYIPNLTKLNRFLSSRYGLHFFYSSCKDELFAAIKAGLNVVVIHRFLYVAVTSQFPTTIQVIIIMCRETYFDVTNVKNRLIILNPYDVHPGHILTSLFINDPTTRNPLNLLASLQIKLGCEV